jgi:hypothetical protein
MPRQQLRLKGREEVSDRRRDDSGVPEPLLLAVLAQIVATGQFIKEAVDMLRIVGAATCVPVQVTDTFVYASRPGKTWRTRFVLDRIAEPTQFVTVLLAPNVPGRVGPYNLLASYFGEVSPPEVDDENAFRREADAEKARTEARTFWQTRALILGADDIMCPACGKKQIRKHEVEGLCRGGEVKCKACWHKA